MIAADYSSHYYHDEVLCALTPGKGAVWSLGVYGALGRVVGSRDEPGGQRAGQPVGRVDVAAEQHHRDVAGAGPLERGGCGLGAGARYPGVVEEEYGCSRPGPFGPKSVRVGVPALLARPDDQPRHR